MKRNKAAEGFTLVEMMVSAGILSLIVLLLVTMTDHTSAIWRRTTGKAEQFREARAAFETITTRLSQATLNTYWAYDNPLAPRQYERRSELRFISGPISELFGTSTGGRVTHGVFFQLPLGMSQESDYAGFETLLSTCGYFLEYGNDEKLRPSFINEQTVPLRYRYRLKELWQPAEENYIYKRTSGIGRYKYAGKEWFQEAVSATPEPVHVIAENVIALVITPRLSKTDEEEVRETSPNPSTDWSPLAPEYLYDSSPVAAGQGGAQYRDGRLNPVHQLPPMLQVTMVAIDEHAAQRMDLNASSNDPFELSGKFLKSEDYSNDLLQSENKNSLEALLISKRLNYRIFSTNVVIRGAKWSREQTN